MDRQYFRQNISPTHTFNGTVAHILAIIAKNVGATYGPFGTFNLFKNGPDVTASKDGFENITMMKFDGSIAQTVHQMTLELASHQAFTVGDGTTSIILIMAAVYDALTKSEVLSSQYTPSEIAAAGKRIQETLVNALQASAIPLTTPEEAAALVHTSTDGNNDLTEILMEIYATVENLADKNIILDTSSSDESYIRTIQGVNISGRLMDNAFANHDIDSCVLRNAEVIIIDGKVNISNDILNYANKLKTMDKSLLIICSGVNENFYRYIQVMAQKQPEILRNICVAYSPVNTIQDKDTFYDVLKITNCAYLEENTEISAQNIEQLVRGSATNISLKDKKITMAGFNQTPEFDAYLESLTEKLDELENTASGSLSAEDKMANRVDQSKLRARIEMLSNGVMTIYVGGETNQRKSINYRLIEDGLKALQSTIRYGYVSGCNSTVMNILVRMIASEKQLSKDGKPNVYLELLNCILDAYISVYHKLILNRKVLSKDELMECILTPEAYDDYKKISELVIPKFQELTFKIFAPIDLRGANNKQIINPVQTDMNIAQRAIDAAIVLATSHTIFVEDMEFDAQP
jgi:chaperonin GroEL (HSP60 family)